MRFDGNRLRALSILIGLVTLAALPAVAQQPPPPIFGPATYVRTTGDANTYTDNFPSPAAGSFVLWVRNGDEDGHRVSSGSIDVNGATVVTTSDFNQQVRLIVKPVNLVAGANNITVTLTSQPGSFITVLITPMACRPEGTVGRLVLPWATAPNLVLALKNGSHEYPREFRVVYFDPAGNPVATSGRRFLPPRASFSAPAVALITEGSWAQGSIEVFYAGRGPGRVFGQAVSTDAMTGVASIMHLLDAGHNRIDAAPPRLPLPGIRDTPPVGAHQ